MAIPHNCASPQTQEYTLKKDPVPDQPLWLPHIPALLEALRAETAPALLARSDFEQLFGVRRRRAILLLHRCAASRRGRELVATREAVVAFLEGCRDDDAAERTAARDRQVGQALAEARRARTLPTIPLPPPDRLSAITFAGLPSGIELTSTQLSVTFSSAQDLVEKLFTVAQALANDYETLETTLASAGNRHEPA